MSQSDPSSSQSPTDFLNNVKFGPAPVSPDSAVTASDLLAAYDPAKLHPLAQIGDKLDYLLLDEEKTSDLPGASTAIPSRGWSDDLCYGTGTMYLGGTLDLFHITTFDTHPPHFFHERRTLSQYIRRRPIFSFLIVFACHMLTLAFKVWPLGAHGDYVKVPGGLLLCQTQDCG